MRQLVATAVVLALAWSGQAGAAESAGAVADSAGSKDASSITSLEEVVVSGKLDTLGGIRKALQEAEHRFYDRYNLLNEDPDYDIVCRNGAPTGTRISRETCQAHLVDETTREEARSLFHGYGPVTTTPINVLRDRTAIDLKERTLQLLKTDPELKQFLLEHARLQQMYEDMRKEKFEGWPGVR